MIVNLDVIRTFGKPVMLDEHRGVPAAKLLGAARPGQKEGDVTLDLTCCVLNRIRIPLTVYKKAHLPLRLFRAERFTEGDAA